MAACALNCRGILGGVRGPRRPSELFLTWGADKVMLPELTSLQGPPSLSLSKGLMSPNSRAVVMR